MKRLAVLTVLLLASTAALGGLVIPCLPAHHVHHHRPTVAVVRRVRRITHHRLAAEPCRPSVFDMPPGPLTATLLPFSPVSVYASPIVPAVSTTPDSPTLGPPPWDGWWFPMGGSPLVSHHRRPRKPPVVWVRPRPEPAPEIDPGAAGAALTLLAGIVAMARGRRI